MKLRKNKTARRLTALLLAAILFALCAVSASAEDESESGVRMSAGSCTHYETITARFHEMFSDSLRDMEVEYSDEFFLRDDDVFYLDLARASFGMAVSAFRNRYDEPGAAEDKNILSFFAQAGFGETESVWYDREPTEDSIATVIAQKQIGDTTVVALICCGADYGDEWIGNLTVGSGTEHEGFSSAADICEERLLDYLDRYELKDHVKLWTSGFSRGSAVANLLAARMTGSGLFTAVYGYFFATPNNTQEPAALPNLFNIVGQYDPVAKTPLSAWGYGRSGVDLYTPSQEANSRFISAALSANEVFENLTGEEFRNNPGLNRQLHVVGEYLLQIFPTAQDYAEILQPQLISLWQYSGSNLLVLLSEALDNIRGFDYERQAAVDSLKDYLDQVIYEYISGNEDQIQDGSWHTDDRLSANLTLEHTPAIYAAWIFSSDDPEQIFVSGTETVRLVIEGNFDLEIWDDAGIVQTVSSQSEPAYYVPGGERRPADAENVCLYAVNRDGKAAVGLPCDGEYTLKLRFAKDDNVTLFSCVTSYGSGDQIGSDVLSFHAKAGECLVIRGFSPTEAISVTTENGDEVRCFHREPDPGSLSVLLMEELTSRNFSLTAVMSFAMLMLAMLLLLLTAALFAALLGRKRKFFRTTASVCFAGASLVLCVGAYFYSDVLPNFPILPAALAVLAFVFTGINALRYRSGKGVCAALLLAAAAFAEYDLLFAGERQTIHRTLLIVFFCGSVVITFLAARRFERLRKNGQQT